MSTRRPPATRTPDPRVAAAAPAARINPLGKLAPPRLGRVFARQRLFVTLDALAESPALWLWAAPGSGKSTLIASWLAARAQPVFWLQVDRGDQDPATLVQSLDALFTAAAGRPLDLPAFHSDDLSDLAGWLRRRIRRLLPELPAGWTLVFDNHQELPDESPLHAALAQSLAELPRGVQWLFISRSAPPGAYAGALLRQQLVQLDPVCLRFDSDETLALARLHGRPDSAVAALAAAEGWAGGMMLMLLGRAPLDEAAPLPAQERLFDYFAEEVMARMTPAEQDTLSTLAYLPAATPAMAEALSGDVAAGTLLEQLAAASLFTDRRDSDSSAATGYVFHALFSEFLRRRFERLQPAPRIAALRRSAGLLLIGHGHVDAGLQRLLDAGCWSDAQAVLLQHAPVFVASGRTAALLDRIDALPPEHAGPLRYWRGLCLLDSDPAAALRELEAAHHAATASGRIEADVELAIAAAASTALVALRRLPELDRWIAVLDHHAEVAAAEHDEEREIRLVPGLLAALVFRAPWHALAEPLATRAERLLHRDTAPGQRLLLGSLAFHLLWRGHVDRLERIVQRIDALGAQQLASPVTLLRWWGIAILVKTLLGDNASARVDADRALQLAADEPSVATLRTAAELQRMIVALAEADAAAARRHFDRAAASLHPDQAADRTTLEHQRGMLALLEGDRPTALRLMRAAVASARASGFPMREHIALIAQALAEAHDWQHEAARLTLDEVFAHPFFADCRWHHWIGGSVASYAALQRGALPEALDHLRLALAAAKAHGFRHGPMLFICGDMMARLAALALEHGIEPKLVRDIVERNRLEALPDAAASWPWPLTIHTLGGWSIARGDGSAPAGRKQSPRLLELLRLLAAQAGEPLAQDLVADQLWPDADGDAARNSLDNAVHRLRKWLGDDELIVLRHGALALNRQRCWIDAAALEHRLQQLDSADTDALPALLGQIRKLYRGHLLPDDASAVIAQRRVALQRRLRFGLQQAARRLTGAGLAQEAAETASLAESLPDL